MFSIHAFYTGANHYSNHGSIETDRCYTDVWNVEWKNDPPVSVLTDVVSFQP